MNPSLDLDRTAFRFNWCHAADLGHHTEITLQDVPNREHTLRLFAEDEEIELQKKGNWSWTPARRQYALWFFATYTR